MVINQLESTDNADGGTLRRTQRPRPTSRRDPDTNSFLPKTTWTDSNGTEGKPGRRKWAADSSMESEAVAESGSSTKRPKVGQPQEELSKQPDTAGENSAKKKQQKQGNISTEPSTQASPAGKRKRSSGNSAQESGLQMPSEAPPPAKRCRGRKK